MSTLGIGPGKAAWLAVALCGCSLSTAGTAAAPLSPDAGSTGTPTGDATTTTGPTANGGDGSVQDATPEAAVDAGPPGCNLSGKHALRIQTRVDWEPKVLAGIVNVIEGGTGDLDMVVLADLERDGNALEGTIQVCDAQVPSFTSTIVGERYGVLFDHEVWEAPTMPQIPVEISLQCPEIGCSLEAPPLSVLLGVEMADPSAAWPMDRTELTYPDHDSDSFTGITLDALGPDAGNMYQYPPTSYDPFFPQRVDQLMLGIRVNAALEGMLDSCAKMSGQATELTIETHASTCTLARGGGTCTAEQTEFVDGNLPKWRVLNSSFTTVLLNEVAGCEAARDAF